MVDVLAAIKWPLITLAVLLAIWALSWAKRKLAGTLPMMPRTAGPFCEHCGEHWHDGHRCDEHMQKPCAIVEGDEGGGADRGKRS